MAGMAASERDRARVVAAYEHPTVVRLCHWLAAFAIVVLTGSGLEIFRAFPSFAGKIPQHDLLDVPEGATLGGWLGGALQWHLTFAWLLVACGAMYVAYQLASGRLRKVLVTRHDLRGALPMALFYLRLGPKPAPRGVYNPLQKLAYTSTIARGGLAVLTGTVLYKPVQLGAVAALLGGFAWVRVWHFVAMCGFLAFVPVHLVMVVLHGWRNFVAMLVGWKTDPEYARQPGSDEHGHG